VALVIGANPTDGHPVFASRLKKRLRQGAGLIVIDPRRIDLVEGPAYGAGASSAAAPGTNVAVLTALAHVIVAEKLYDEDFIRSRCDWDEFRTMPNSSPIRATAPKRSKSSDRRPGRSDPPRRGAPMPPAAMRQIYYGLGVTEHSQGSTTVMASPTLRC
jgi:formate dehydrogenase major subunit